MSSSSASVLSSSTPQPNSCSSSVSLFDSSSKPVRALLVLANGAVFEGISIGAAVAKQGELVFNTAITGYQEILTDPSYCQQIVTLTYPHLGNVGVNAQDAESAAVHCAGLVVRDVPSLDSNFRREQGLLAYLQAAGVPGIANIDTRALTQILRTEGAQNACLMAEGWLDEHGQPGEVSVDKALAMARAFPGLAGADLAKVVTTAKAYEWTEGEWSLQASTAGPGFTATNERFHVVAMDFGVKRNILRMLAQRGCRVTVVPAQTSADAILALKPDGLFLSNGPGDPEPCTYAIEAIRSILQDTQLPVFGICLGHQLLALASGAKTIKMKFGHHGANHPVQEIASTKVAITSQNHGFAVDPASLPPLLRITHVSLFDGSIQGIERLDRPAFSFQGHPEASPGPQDLAALFDRFTAAMSLPQQKVA